MEFITSENPLVTNVFDKDAKFHAHKNMKIGVIHFSPLYNEICFIPSDNRIGITFKQAQEISLFLIEENNKRDLKSGVYSRISKND